MPVFMRPIRPFGTILFLLILNLGCRASMTAVDTAEKIPRNVILFIGDGLGPAQITMARDYDRAINDDGRLYLDEHLRGSVRTYSADNRVTDSAAGATAFATGAKSYNGAIAVDTFRNPLTTLVEIAEELGMATGLVATSRITHATPAAFSAHVPDRAMESEIAEQQIREDIDVLIGGGGRYYLPKSQGGSREDGRNLFDEARELDYAVADDLDELRAAATTPLLALVAMDHLAYEIDRDPAEEPSLAEMTGKAIELLEKTGKPFFLMVEGSRIDHASHGNDPIGTLHDVIAYDDAFRTALEFARRSGNTLVVGVSDHETGGLSVGRSVAPAIEGRLEEVPTFWRAFAGYDDYGWNPAALARGKNSAEVIAATIREARNLREVMRELAGVEELSEEEHLALERAAEDGDLARVVGEIVSRRAGIGWTTGGHTAVDVGLYAYGPGSDRLSGNVENSYVGRVLHELIRRHNSR